MVCRRSMNNFIQHHTQNVKQFSSEHGSRRLKGRVASQSPSSAKRSFGCHYLQVILAFRERAKHANCLREESESEEGEK